MATETKFFVTIDTGALEHDRRRSRTAAERCAHLRERDEVQDRCAAISRECLGFDPRANAAPELRAVEPDAVMIALSVAYRAGLAAR